MKKHHICFFTGVVSFFIFLILQLVVRGISNSLDDQNLAKRWNEKGGTAQISCFFSNTYQIDEDRISEFEHGLDSYLVENSITLESTNPGARLWASCYSAEGSIELVSQTGRVSADAYGIGGDFFLFHPVPLLNGAYFSGNDVNKDYCVIDEDAAWQLFGSNDVAGMMVTINGVPHMVTGVIRRPVGSFWEAAGMDSARVYVSYESLSKYGIGSGINCYEILMPNAVKDFAYKYVKENLGSNERETEVLQNTNRLSFVRRVRVMKDFGIRSMNGKSIIYPAWENVARGKEDICILITAFQCILLLGSGALFCILAVYLYRHKTWTMKGLWCRILDMTDRIRTKRYIHQHKKEEE